MREPMTDETQRPDINAGDVIAGTARPREGRATTATTRQTPHSPHALGEHVRSHRLIAGLSAEEMAQRAGIALGYYGEIERGRRTPSVRVLRRLSEALHISLGELVAAPDLVPPAPPVDPRRVLLKRLLETSASLDVEGLRSLLDYAGYLGQGRLLERRSRPTAPAPSPVPLFPENEN